MAFKGEFSDGSIHQFISSLDPYRINVVSLVQLSGLLYCFSWADRSVRNFEKSFLSIHTSVDGPSGGGADAEAFSDESKAQRAAAEMADPTLSIRTHARSLSEHENIKLEEWYKCKTSKTPGVSIVSRIVILYIYYKITIPPTLELLKSLNKKYFTRELVELLFCSICTSQAAEAQLQRVIKPALGFVMTMRNRRIDAHHKAYSQSTPQPTKTHEDIDTQTQASTGILPTDELLMEMTLIKDEYYSIEHVMQVIKEDIHDIGSILYYEYECAHGQLNLHYDV